ncbi:N-methyl-L-tryptophan oxidase [Planococcus lenghuensis]|uniref:N-methyltryptophan oxidase n=1 Tax=Planococcus lenghuensis TaxID=2213202 RepID=A0A1Q2KX50_9BACL|nr:N-methyl-L-tryptophan oxidase [Planococcus lenghuensis]AQQ52397.1 N-methyltryptophan oxidase [Planococcus lenghuensis]
MNVDAIIIGAGAMGMAAGYYLAKQNQKVVLIDPHDPPHTQGSHHGETRLIRHAYGEGENYVPMALRAQKLWVELERESKRKVFHQTGVLNFGTPDSAFLKNVRRSVEVHSLPADFLTAQEVNERWPGFQLSEELIACYEPNSGILMSEEAIRAYRELAEKHGAELLVNTRLQEIIAADNGITITTDNQTVTGRKLIITAGRGTNTVLKLLGQQLPLQPMRTNVSWFQADAELHSPSIFPAWAYDDGETGFYGFPDIDGAGLKIGDHNAGVPMSPEEALTPFGTEPEDGQHVSGFLRTHMGLEPVQRKGQTCIYTNSPDEDFIIDHLPEHRNIIVACGFSGHGFKFASAVGEILSDLAIRGKTEANIAGFTISRFK